MKTVPCVAVLSLVVALLVGNFFLPSTQMPISVAEAQSIPNLKDTLSKGLKARQPKEFAFVDKVVLLVEKKKLPLKMVMTSFKWARDRSEKIPFVYFENALRTQAKKINVAI